MNPHGNMSNTYNTWLVMMTIYNLLLWLCMKHKFLMMLLLISGPRQSGNDIDVYLTPIIEDLKIILEEEIEVFDAYCQELSHFKLYYFGQLMISSIR